MKIFAWHWERTIYSTVLEMAFQNSKCTNKIIIQTCANVVSLWWLGNVPNGPVFPLELSAAKYVFKNHWSPSCPLLTRINKAWNVFFNWNEKDFWLYNVLWSFKLCSSELYELYELYELRNYELGSLELRSSELWNLSYTDSSYRRQDVNFTL